MTENDIYIAKAMGAGIPISRIAKKLSMSEAAVQQAWERILNECQSRKASGYEDLSAFFVNMCKQYNLMGDSLKEVGCALANLAGDDEVLALLDSDPKKTLANLRQNTIILRAWKPSVLPIAEVPPGEVSSPSSETH